MSTFRADLLAHNVSAKPPGFGTRGDSIKGWATFNGTGTVAVNGSLNLSSLADSGVGVYTVTFTASLTAPYSAISGFHFMATTAGLGTQCVNRNAGSFAVNVVENSVVADSTDVNYTVWGAMP